MSRRIPITLGLAAAAALASPHARACGGTFVADDAPAGTAVTRHRVAIAIAPTMTTLWDQIDYVGDPTEFAWVLPTRGAVTVGLGSDDFLQALDRETAPRIHAPVRRCARPRPDGCGGSGTAGCGADQASPDDFDFDAGYQEDAGIWVTGREVVGPYAAVQVHGEDPSAITAWLRIHHYAVPTAIEPALATYVTEGFDFLAVRLRPGRGVRTIQPIRVSMRGVVTSVPLRLAAASAASTVAMDVFVISDRRFRTRDLPTFAVDPAALTWDFAAERSDYEEVRARTAASFGGRAFALEASFELSRASLPEAATAPMPGEGDAGVDAEILSDAPAGDTAGDDAATDGAVADATSDAPPAPEVGSPPGVDPSATDVEIAFGTLTTRRVTRLHAELPFDVLANLDRDLELEVDPEQGILEREVEVARATSVPTCPGTASIADVSGDRPTRATLGLLAAAIAAVLARRAARR